MTKIFISYRRDDDPYAARGINDALCKKFHDRNVFFDLESIKRGLDFRPQIDRMVGMCDVMLVVIGDSWLQLDESGRSRLEDDNDFVSYEVSSALKRNIPVIPVLVGNATIPDKDTLPAALTQLIFRQGVQVRATEDFSAQIEKLLKVIEEVAPSRDLGFRRWVYKIVPIVAFVAIGWLAWPQIIYLVSNEEVIEAPSDEGVLTRIEGKEAFEPAEESGEMSALHKLALDYYYGQGVEKSYEIAFPLFMEAALQNDASAQTWVGYMYDLGLGVEQDNSRALEWYRRAAEQGYAAAQSNMGTMYRDGIAVEQDYSKALEWYRRAAEQGYAAAQGNIGNVYMKAYGVKQDYAKALEWFRKGAEQGDQFSQGNLGRIYKHGLGVTQDYSVALKWFRKAAEQGDLYSQRNLGTMYRDGLGVTRDYSVALEWYRIAAERGDSTAQANVGWMHENGYGVNPNRSEAIKWYRKAAKQGEEFSITKLAELGVSEDG